MNCCLLAYSLDATDWPSIRLTICGANTSVIEPVPSRQLSKALRMVCRFVSLRSSPASVIGGSFHAGTAAGVPIGVTVRAP
jgi:hypothetical protein